MEVFEFGLCCAETTFRRFWSLIYAVLRQRFGVLWFDLCCAETTF